MSVLRTKTNTTRTHQLNAALADPLRISIIEALGHAELSRAELAELHDIDERLMAYHLHVLMQADAIEELHHGYHYTYAVTQPQLTRACHLLYELWAKEAVRAHSHAAVRI